MFIAPAQIKGQSQDCHGIGSRLLAGNCPRVLEVPPGHLARGVSALPRALFLSETRGGSSRLRGERAVWAAVRSGARSAPNVPVLRAHEDTSPEPRRRCNRCGGRGYITWHPHWDNGHEVCPVCHGSRTVVIRSEEGRSGNAAREV